MVEGVIDSFPGRIGRDEWIKQAKGLAKGAGAKKPAAKRATAKKKPGPKPGTKRGKLTASGKKRQKPGPKPKSGSAKGKASKAKAGPDVDKIYANVRKYHGSAKRSTVESVVKYCGASLYSRDSALIACSDEAEVKRVANGFAKKKLGLKSGQMDAVQATCQEMKGDRFKNRAVFYYLMAKRAGKLGIFK